MTIQVLKERYLVREQLSKNAGRRTLLAEDLQTQELVVIKLLIFNENFQWDNLKLFEREAQTLQLLSHPAIPRYLDYFDIHTAGGQGFALVQSYIPAKSLSEWLKIGRTFSEAEVKQLAKALLEILNYLHSQQPQVIHRDLKPSNILLENRSGNNVGEVYLIDFGSVNTLAAKKGNTITVVGTYGYMPPEQFGGRAVPASDLYSLGATLIYLVTGRHPAELSQDNLQIKFESAVNLNSDLIDWLKWMTQPSLNRRLKSAGEALKALEQPRQSRALSAVRQKPFGSKIKINKNWDNVEIFIPPKRLSFCILSWAFIPAIFFFILSIPYGFIYLFILCGTLLSFSTATRLNLNQEEISLAYVWLWCKFQNTTIMKQDIKALIYTLGDFQNQGSKGKSYTSHFALKITIITRQNQYISLDRFGYLNQITPPEISWLANEISEWSGVPITVNKKKLF